jgi:hypothetical protein
VEQRQWLHADGCVLGCDVDRVLGGRPALAVRWNRAMESGSRTPRDRTEDSDSGRESKSPSLDRRHGYVPAGRRTDRGVPAPPPGRNRSTVPRSAIHHARCRSEIRCARDRWPSKPARAYARRERLSRKARAGARCRRALTVVTAETALPCAPGRRVPRPCAPGDFRLGETRSGQAVPGRKRTTSDRARVFERLGTRARRVASRTTCNTSVPQAAVP